MHNSSTWPSISNCFKESFTNVVYLATLRKSSKRPAIQLGFGDGLSRSTSTKKPTLSFWRAPLQLLEMNLWNLANISCVFFYHSSSSCDGWWLSTFSNDNSPHEFIDLSEALETAGTSAYTGAIQYISNDSDVGLPYIFFHGGGGLTLL